MMKHLPLLKHFDEFTKRLSQRSEAISSVLPTFRCLLSLLHGKEHENAIIKKLKATISDGLKSRMSATENKRLKFLCEKKVFRFLFKLFENGDSVGPSIQKPSKCFPKCCRAGSKSNPTYN